MKFIIVLILTALLSIAACLFMPWWSIAIVAYLMALITPLKPLVSFSAAFLALFIGWGVLAWYISANNSHLLAQKVSLIIIKTDSPYLLILSTALVGGLVAGLAALSGSLLRRVPE